ncbi:Replicase RepFR55 [Bacillus thuringiensis]|uniref:Replicase RepFR55 n=1 Tax=Bacillus thuringiensis TaxID=1428 RepID=UPI000676EEAD|nr:Replicase RepFR55 [Bacillus thuringiensis]AKR13039.1 Replicase RepFR55 [Bacillus thuringiensis]MBZ8125446.1 Replicase RepFR55 [Bacillus thuringiensis]PGP43659.1 Replicase RepFR55 [Bacillus thuringiensis]
MLLRNFLLSRAKAELSPHIHHLPKTPGAINQAIKKITSYIDSIVLECEGATTKDYLTKRKYEALETVLSYLVQEGYSQVRQEHISKKSGISKPIINYVFNWLQDLGVCQQIKVRRHGKISPSVYILTIHDNYLKIVEYFKVKWAVAINVCSTFTRFLKNKISKKSDETNLEFMQKNNFKPSPSLDFFGIEEQSKNAVDYEKKEKNKRLQDLNDYLSDDQKRAYYYILSQELTYLSENDAYTIALRLPPDIDRYTRWDFEECVQWFKFKKAENSNPAHFIKMFNQKSKQNQDRRKCNAQNTSSLLDTNNSQTFVFYNFLEEHN